MSPSLDAACSSSFINPINSSKRDDLGVEVELERDRALMESEDGRLPLLELFNEGCENVAATLFLGDLGEFVELLPKRSAN